MKILHTADWHLGKRLYHIERLNEQRAVLAEIEKIVEEEAIDIVCIAGDIFDIPNPSAESSQLFYQTIKNITRDKARLVIAIAGNHDSADRIAAPDMLALSNGIILVGHPNTEIESVQLDNGYEIIDSAPGFIKIKAPDQTIVNFLLTPFVNEIRLKQHFELDQEDAGINAYLKTHWHTLVNTYCAPSEINLLLSHLYLSPSGVSAPPEPDGEKPIKLGNASLIDAMIIPEEIDYAALGHLHHCHSVKGTATTYYSGSPIAYSFSEAGQQKYVNIVQFDKGKKMEVRKRALKSGLPLLRKKVYSVEEALNYVQDNNQAHIELTVICDEMLSAEATKAIQSASQHLVIIIPMSLSVQEKTLSSEAVAIDDIDTLFQSYFESFYEVAPSEELQLLFNEIKSQQL